MHKSTKKISAFTGIESVDTEPDWIAIGEGAAWLISLLKTIKQHRDVGVYDIDDIQRYDKILAHINSALSEYVKDKVK